MTVQRCDDQVLGTVSSDRPVAVGLIRYDADDSWTIRRQDRAMVSVKAWMHGYRLVGVLELTPVIRSSARQQDRDAERVVLDRMSDLVGKTGARTVLTLGPVDCPELEDALAWSGLRARPIERWLGRRNDDP